MRILSLALRFLLELALLVALGVWGFTVGGGTITKVVLGIGAPLASAIAWGLFVAPKAPRRLDDPARPGVALLGWPHGTTLRGSRWSCSCGWREGWRCSRPATRGGR